jgi:RHS repeat-associated protein
LARTDNNLGGYTYYHADGNGNITCLIDGTQTVVARYLYDPYGKILDQSGSMADANLYRFSSKEFHANSGLVYYLYRFYDPGLQRWPNRDPIEEEGGVNLYTAVSNDPVNLLDPLGLSDENNPPISVSGPGNATYGPCRLSPDQCAAILSSIMRKLAKLQGELGKYNPITDGAGGFPLPGGGVTKPGGHYNEIQQLIQGIRNDIKQYLKNCTGGGNPPIPKGVYGTINNPVPPPKIRLPQPPLYGPLPFPLPFPMPVPVPVAP